MKARFLHLADIHLGYDQYHCAERGRDFFLTFSRAVGDALSEHVDLVLIAGDLFHQRNLSPTTLLHATSQLDRLKSAGIPVIAVAGNHDQMGSAERFSWLDFLASNGLLIHLCPNLNVLNRSETPDGPDELFSEYRDHRGGYFQIGEIAIFGIPYLGAIAPRVLAESAAHLQRFKEREQPAFTILVTHAGLQGILPAMTGVMAVEHLYAIRQYVDYLALGHVHKPHQTDGWIFNPGSPEPLDVGEAGFSGGGFLVSVDTARDPVIEVTPRKYSRRPFVTLKAKVSSMESIQELYAGVERLLNAHHRPTVKPVVELSLEGTLHFPRSDLDVGRIEEMVKERFDPLVTLVRNRAVPAELDVGAGTSDLTRPELEWIVLRDLIAQDSRYRDRAEGYAALIRDIKEMALNMQSPEVILEQVRAGMGNISSRGQDAHPED